MARDPLDGKEMLSELIDDIVTNMTGPQFAALVERTGHTEIDPKQAAAEALAARVNSGNLVPEGATTSDVLAALRRRNGKGWGK